MGSFIWWVGEDSMRTFLLLYASDRYQTADWDASTPSRYTGCVGKDGCITNSVEQAGHGIPSESRREGRQEMTMGLRS
jgi:hypothetical protein